jgi:hypothetical protein
MHGAMSESSSPSVEQVQECGFMPVQSASSCIGKGKYSGKEPNQCPPSLKRADGTTNPGECDSDDGEAPALQEATGKKKRKKLKRLVVNLSMCKYPVISDCCAAMGWVETAHEVISIYHIIFEFQTQKRWPMDASIVQLQLDSFVLCF